jgi:SAM-dependent methyltransferase
MTGEGQTISSGGVWTPVEYYATRYCSNAYRDRIWKHITDYLMPFLALPGEACVLELGCGYGAWIRNFEGAQKFAIDVHPELPRLLAAAGCSDVAAHVGSCTDLTAWSPNSLDVVLASNLLEHLLVADVLSTMREVARVLKPGGVFCVIQPNFALCPHQYFDDFTHVSIFTDRSLADILQVAGFEISHVWRRFMPFSMKPSTSRLAFLVPLYLRSPWKPFAGQMCLIARKPAS